MSNYDDFLSLLNNYCVQHNKSVNIESNLNIVSYDENNDYHFMNYSPDLKVIDMDSLAHNVLTSIYFDNSKNFALSMASVDAFLISADGTWYFIEFKNQDVKKTKEKVIEKAYQNIYFLFKIFYELKEKGITLKDFDYLNPTKFIKTHYKYILVIGKDKCTKEIGKYRMAKSAGLSLTENSDFLFMTKLNRYVFKDTSIYEEQYFEAFVKNFKY